MTPFWRGLNNIWSGAKNTKRSKKSQALGMTKEKGNGFIKEWLPDRGVFHHLGWAAVPVTPPVPRHAGAGGMTRKGGLLVRVYDSKPRM